LIRDGLEASRAIRADAKELPFEPGRLDGLISLGLLEHFPDHLEVLLYWVSLLRPGGRILLQVPNARRWDWLAFDVVSNLVAKKVWVKPRRTERGWVSTIYSYEERWTASYLSELCEKVGLEQLDLFGVYRASWLEIAGLLLCPRFTLSRVAGSEPAPLDALLLVYAGRKP